MHPHAASLVGPSMQNSASCSGSSSVRFPHQGFGGSLNLPVIREQKLLCRDDLTLLCEAHPILAVDLERFRSDVHARYPPVQFVEGFGGFLCKFGVIEALSLDVLSHAVLSRLASLNTSFKADFRDCGFLCVTCCTGGNTQIGRNWRARKDSNL